jgi:hypothetical protein
MQKLLLAVVFFVFISCTSNKEQTEVGLKKLQIEFKRNVKLSELIQADFSYLPLQTHGAPLIGAVSKIIPTDTSFYIFDSSIQKSIWVFNREGKFLSTIGLNGEGEGEYSRPVDFILADEYVEVCDRGKSSILKYSTSGEFIKEWKIPFMLQEMKFVSSSNRIVYDPNLGPDFDGGHVLYLVADDYNKMEWGHFPYLDGADDVPFPGFLVEHKGIFTFARTLFGEFYQIDVDTREVSTRFHIDFGKYNWPISKEEIVRDSEEAEGLFFKGGIMSGIHRLLETDSYFLFRTIMLDENHDKDDVDEEDDSWLCIYHKQLGKIIAIKDVENDLNGGVFSFPIAVNNNRFLSAINSEKFVRLYSFGEDRLSENKFDSTIMKRLGDVKVDSNPVLLEFSFNKNLFN